MAGLFGKLTRLAQTPQGRRFVAEATRRAQQMANDPATRAKVQRLAERATKRRGGPTH